MEQPKSNLSPLEVEFLLHYYYSIEDHERLSCPGFRAALNRFLDESIMIPIAFTVKSLDQTRSYKLTERGDKLVEMICNTPFPELVWRDPRG